MSDDELIAAWHQIIVGDSKSWVLFRHGTCVILTQPDVDGDIRAQALALMEEWGPVQVGTPSADFNVVELVEYTGWVVTCHHPDILTYVAPADAGGVYGAEAPPDYMIGLLGRSRRAQDAAELNVIHTEDKRRT